MTSLAQSAQHFGDPKSMKFWLATSGLIAINMWLLLHGQMNLACALNIIIILVLIASINRELAVLMIFAYLFLLGDIRRFVSAAIGFPALDLLLLVGPAVGLIISLPLLLRLRLSERISKLVLALMIIMVLEIFNPRQGGVAVGLSGAIFYLVPLFFFWIGRRYGTDYLVSRLLYQVVFPISVLAAILGFYQTYVGFLPWEQAWIDSLGGSLHSLFLASGIIRAFGFSASGVEYMGLLLVGCTIAVSGFLAGKRPIILLFPLLLAALFLASSRTSIVKLIVAMAVVWSLRKGRGQGWILRFAIGLAITAGVLMFVLSRFGGDDDSGPQSAAQLSITHQVGGLTHPLDAKKSTAGMHGSMFLIGLSRGLTNPLGLGLGAATLGSGKFGGDESSAGSSEVDISDVYSSLGLVGGLIYSFLAFLIVRAALEYSQSAPKESGLPVLGILVATGGGWLALGQYGMTPLVWLLIGVLSRAQAEAVFARRTPSLQLNRHAALA
jgi:hypothetical protein